MFWCYCNRSYQGQFDFINTIHFKLYFVMNGWCGCWEGVRLWALGLGLGSGKACELFCSDLMNGYTNVKSTFYFFIITNSVGSGFPGEIFWNPDPNRKIRVVHFSIRDRP